jgi:diguanylate cyclase (GGDEF)-like protein
LPDSASSKKRSTTSANSAEQLLDILSDGVIGVNRDGKVSFINNAAMLLLGLSSEEAVDQPLEKVFRLEKGHKPLDAEFLQHMLPRKITLGPITKQFVKKKDKQVLLVDYSVIPIDDENAVVMFHDLSHTEEGSKTFLYQVSYDPLTHLPNRDAIQQTLSQLHGKHLETKKSYTVLLLDLDRFKLINDNYGHSSGDLLLKQIADHLKNMIRKKDNIGRWGGEEFLCILPETHFKTGLEIAERLRESIARFSYKIGQRDIFTTTSIGVANYPQDGKDLQQILRVADAALYEAKRAGRNRVFSSQEQSGSILNIATQLENALAEQRVLPAYQPIVDLSSGKQVADEALARIVSPNSEPLSASRFIEAAVHLQLVHRIDYEIARQTVMLCSTKVQQGVPAHPHFVNISAELLRHPDLVQGILDTALTQCTACGDLLGNQKPLVIEITEQALLHDIEEAREILAPFLNFGLQLAIDDFGVGYSSLSYLADLPVSYLKIDGQLIQRVAREKKIRAIVKGIQNIASDLGLTTIAEYVDNEETVGVLRDIGVNWGQGYYFGKPQLLHDRFDI